MDISTIPFENTMTTESYIYELPPPRRHSAFSRALAGESIHNEFSSSWRCQGCGWGGKWGDAKKVGPNSICPSCGDENLEILYTTDYEGLQRFAKTVAYKVAHNIAQGYPMDPDSDPLTTANKKLGCMRYTRLYSQEFLDAIKP